MAETNISIREHTPMARAPLAWRFATFLLAAALSPWTAYAQVPQFDHVVVVVMENHSFSEIIGNTTDAPYINSLAASGAVFTESFGIEHPSQPNYLDLFSGSNQGITNDTCVSSLLAADNLGNQLITAAFTFVGYSEDLPSPGSTTCSSGLYQRKHNPWSDFANLSGGSLAAITNQPFSNFPVDFSTLPTLSFVIPNQCHDMHGVSVTCPVGTAAIITAGDTWLQTNLDAYVHWAPGHNSLLVLTWDEDDNSQSNQIPTIFTGALVVPGNYSETINHFNVLATLEAMYGLTPVGSDTAKAAVPITDVFRIFADGFE